MSMANSPLSMRQLHFFTVYPDFMLISEMVSLARTRVAVEPSAEPTASPCIVHLALVHAFVSAMPSVRERLMRLLFLLDDENECADAQRAFNHCTAAVLRALVLHNEHCCAVDALMCYLMMRDLDDFGADAAEHAFPPCCEIDGTPDLDTLRSRTEWADLLAVACTRFDWPLVRRVVRTFERERLANVALGLAALALPVLVLLDIFAWLEPLSAPIRRPLSVLRTVDNDAPPPPPPLLLSRAQQWSIGRLVLLAAGARQHV